MDFCELFVGFVALGQWMRTVEYQTEKYRACLHHMIKELARLFSLTKQTRLSRARLQLPAVILFFFSSLPFFRYMCPRTFMPMCQCCSLLVLSLILPACGIQPLYFLMRTFISPLLAPLTLPTSLPFLANPVLQTHAFGSSKTLISAQTQVSHNPKI